MLVCVFCADSMLLACLTDSGCSCCSMAAVASSLASLVEQCTDIDTDARDAALQHTANAWPLPIREAVWNDRLTFRQLLKQQTRALTAQLTAASTSTPPLDLTQLPPASLLSAYHFTVRDLHVALRSYPFSAPYTHLLHALLTQLLHAEQAGLEAGDEGETRAERLFAYCLHRNEQTAEACVDEEYFALQEAGWHERLHETLRGKLLPRRMRRAEGEEAEEESHAQKGASGSFRRHRRLLRLFIFRFGLARLLDGLVKQQPSQQGSVDMREATVQAVQ